MQYSIPYLFVAGILFLLYLKEIGRIRIGKSTSKSAIWIAYTIMWVFVGLRGHILSDFIGYVPYFEDIGTLGHLRESDIINRNEIGFNIYTVIFKSLCPNYFTWVAFNTLIDLVVLGWFFKRYCKSMILPLIFFMAFNGLLMEFNLYRNMKAIDLFLISIPYLQERKIIPYMLLNIMGFFFHMSALLYLPIYFVLNLKIPKVLMWGGFALSNVIYLFHISVISDIINSISFMQSLDAFDKIVSYASRAVESTISIGYIERTISFLLFTILYHKLVRIHDYYKLFYNCFWIYYCTILIFYEVTVFAERVPYLFMFSYWILYPAVINLRLKIKPFINIFASLLVVLKIMTGFNYEGASYQNVLFNNPNYFERKNLIEKQLN